MNVNLEISLRARSLRLSAGVNDAPIVINHLGEGQQARMPIDWWLAPEGNVLTVSVSAAPGVAQKDPMLDVAVAFPEDRKAPLCRLLWGLPKKDRFEPFRLVLPFSPPTVKKSRIWEEARPFLTPLNPEQLRGARAAGMKLHRFFLNKDANRVVDLLEYRLYEMAHTFDIDLGTHREQVRKEFTDIVKKPGFAMIPVREEAIRVTPCAFGRVFHLSREDGGEIIATKETEQSFPTTMQVYVAMVNGEWLVVR
jgi:hypothetical protein